MRIKRIHCRSCGAQKQTEPKTGYVYCDYCGTFIGWDYYRSIGTPGSGSPGPAYKELSERLAPKLDKALKKGNRELYAELQRELFTLHIEQCPADYSPRIGDPAYRIPLIDYLGEQYTIYAFDKEIQKLYKKMDQAMAKIQYREDEDRVLVTSKSFWALFSITEELTNSGLALAEESGVLSKHPDAITVELSKPATYSLMAEAWLPYLSTQDEEKLFERTGLGGEYIEYVPPDLTTCHCGSCGNELPVVQGAKNVLCENCGFIIHVEGGEVPCSVCGSPLAVPANRSEFSCPYCSALNRLL